MDNRQLVYSNGSSRLALQVAQEFDISVGSISIDEQNAVVVTSPISHSALCEPQSCENGVRTLVDLVSS